MLTSETTIVPRPVECTSTCTVVPECDTVTVRSPPAFTYVLKLGPHLLGIMKSYLTEAPPLSLEQFSVAVPSSFDRLTEQSPDTDFAAYFAPMGVFVTWQVARAAAGSTSEATIRMRGRSRFMSGWRRGIGNTAHSVIPPGRPPLFPNTGDPRITSYLTMMCRRGSEAAPCIHATSPAHTRHPPRGHRRDCRGDPDAGRVRRVGRAHHVSIGQQRAAPDHRQRRRPGRPPRDPPGKSGRPPPPPGPPPTRSPRKICPPAATSSETIPFTSRSTTRRGRSSTSRW